MPAESFDILGTLVIVVLKAQNLIDNHKFYKQDPYAQITLNGTTQKTPVDPKGGQHPVWDEEFRFPIPKNIAGKSKVLHIACHAQEKKDDTLLGEGDVDISETLRSGEFDDWVPLKIGDTQRGEIYLEMTFFAAGPAPLNRRKSKFKPQDRLARPPQTSLPPTNTRLGHASYSTGSAQPNTPPQQYLNVPGRRSQSDSPKGRDSALPPIPAEPAVPATLRAGLTARPRVVSDAGYGTHPIRPGPQQPASNGARPETLYTAHAQAEPELPTPTQRNPLPNPYATGTQPHSGAVPAVASVYQYPPHSTPARITSHSQPPTEPYVTPYPPYNSPATAPAPAAQSTSPRRTSYTASAQPASSVPSAGFSFPVPELSPTPAPPAGHRAPATFSPVSQYHPPAANYSSSPAPYLPPSSPYRPSTLPYQSSSSPYPAVPPPGGYPYTHGPSPRPHSQPSRDSLPDPYLERRYQTPLPLPPSEEPRQPRPAPPTPAPPTSVLAQPPRANVDELEARKLQQREEEEARARREQEERDAALARSLDLELNLGPDETLPPRHEDNRTGMPGGW